MRQLLDDNGLRYLELEFLGDWFLDPDDERRKASDERRAFLFEAASQLPAHHIKVGNIVGTECDLPRVVERYGELCADAARHTDAKIVYEFMPYDVNVGDLETALEVVEGADAPNGGLAFDTWHLGKLRLEPDELRAVPPRWVSWVELCDGPYEYAEDRLDEVINRRKLPGEGEFPIVEYVVRVSASSATTARGGSRCSPRSSATSRSSRSSTAPTRRRARSSPPRVKGALGV